MTDLASIVRCAIHPGLGIARVGNSPDDFFVGPEVPGRPTDPGGSGYKDASGRVKRQAARFRVFGYDAQDRVVGELDASNARVSWRVHIANRKAAWYQFQNAMDLGDHALSALPRNASLTGAARRQLVIDPGPRRIEGANQAGGAFRFDSGAFMGDAVYLGEVRTDDMGRLLVLGGRGTSASKPPAPATTFANNDGWHDDVADGTVRATVTLGGRVLEADPAMVAVAPPNFAPGLYGVVTMYDVAVDLFQRELGLGVPPDVQFWRDIFPIFERLVAAQAVNLGIFLAFGHGSPADFTQADLLAHLASPAAQDAQLRQAVFQFFRDPDDPIARGALLPPFYGDAFSEFPTDGRVGLAVTRTQRDALRQWAQGTFTPGIPPATPAADLDAVPLAERPRALDRAHLEDCLGGPFHPGIELTWPLRLKMAWRAPFRLRVLPEGTDPRDDWGPMLSPVVALAADGPFSANGPGTLTRLLGVPWQTDEASCDAGYEQGTYLPLPTFWAARVPNHVLDVRSYHKLLDTRLPVGQRLKHFGHRQPWLRFFRPVYQQRINAMVVDWDKIGIVTAHTGPTDHAQAGLPAQLWVETSVDAELQQTDATFTQIDMAEHLQGPPPASAALAEPVPTPGRRRPLLGRGER